MTPDAKTAISVLRTLLKTEGADSLAYWVTPNVILTLSGARAYCDGVFWDDKKKGLLAKWEHEIEDSLAALRRSFSLTISETGIEEARPGEKYASFELVSEAGLRYIVGQTKLLGYADQQSFLKQTSLGGLFDEMMAALREQSKFKDYSKESLNHIAFGILLGYPDEAITGSVLRWEENDQLAEPQIDANIRGANYYGCPQPIYSYPRMLATNPAIVQHEQLWSKILTDYYASDFHRSLEARPAFQDKLKELGSLT